MKLHKLKILSTTKIEDGAEIPVSNQNFTFLNDRLITYTIDYGELEEKKIEEAPDEMKEFLKEQAKKKRESEYEFKEKFQIRTGINILDNHEGFKSIALENEKFFETETSRYMGKLFKNFFKKSKIISEKFKKNKRAYLLHSDPGMGKSALIRHFCRESLKNTGTSIIQVSGEIDFQKLTVIFLEKYAEDVERIILIIEDFGRRDYANNSSIYNPSCLNFLDGLSGLFRVPTLIICTTNFIEHLGPQLTNRPGRFNKIIKVVPPKDEEVFALIENISGIQLNNEQKLAFSGKSMTPDHIIEALIRHEIEETSLESCAKEVMQEREGLTTWNN